MGGFDPSFYFLKVLFPYWRSAMPLSGISRWSHSPLGTRDGDEEYTHDLAGAGLLTVRRSYKHGSLIFEKYASDAGKGNRQFSWRSNGTLLVREVYSPSDMAQLPGTCRPSAGKSGDGSETRRNRHPGEAVRRIESSTLRGDLRIATSPSTISYLYDSRGRLVSATFKEAQLSFTLDWVEDQLRTCRARGFHAAFEYNRADRLIREERRVTKEFSTRCDVPVCDGLSAAVRSERRYAYDKGGRILRVDGSGPDLSMSLKHGSFDSIVAISQVVIPRGDHNDYETLRIVSFGPVEDVEGVYVPDGSTPDPCEPDVSLSERVAEQLHVPCHGSLESASSFGVMMKDAIAKISTQAKFETTDLFLSENHVAAEDEFRLLRDGRGIVWHWLIHRDKAHRIITEAVSRISSRKKFYDPLAISNVELIVGKKASSPRLPATNSLGMTNEETEENRIVRTILAEADEFDRRQ